MVITTRTSSESSHWVWSYCPDRESFHWAGCGRTAGTDVKDLLGLVGKLCGVVIAAGTGESLTGCKSFWDWFEKLLEVKFILFWKIVMLLGAVESRGTDLMSLG